MKIKQPINLHKTSTFIVVLSLMFFYHNFSLEAYIYLALHGSYGILWLIKDLVYPDPKWEEEIPFGLGLFVFFTLCLYWVAPCILISQNIQADNLLICITIITNIMGVFLVYVSDAQKYFTLKYQSGLITEGFFTRCRNTNYVGEFLIYFSFALLVQHWLPFVILGFFTSLIFIPNMLKKDQSLARYPEFTDYQKNSGLFFPKL